MKTNLENYEERFVDYMEGQLNAEEMREVEAFVAEHPELEEDFKLFCSTKLEPDITVVYTKKESLMKKEPRVRPLFVRIVAAAACVALLVGVGIRFLKPHQTLEQQPMLAELTPIEAQQIDFQQDNQELRKSNTKVVTMAKTIAEPEAIEVEALEVMEPIELIAAVPAIEAKPLEWTNALANNDIDIRMDIELGERLAMLTPLSDDGSLPVNIGDYFRGNIGQTAKFLYKQTAKTFMTVYYTADYRINEAKDQLVASR